MTTILGEKDRRRQDFSISYMDRERSSQEDILCLSEDRRLVLRHQIAMRPYQ